MYARLSSDWMARGWSDKPYALVNWRSGQIVPIPAAVHFVVSACDGMTQLAFPLFLPHHLRILDELLRQGVVESCLEGDAIDPQQRYRLASNPFIRGIHWAVTGKCNYSCQHCYMEAPDHRYSDHEASSISKILDEFEKANVTRVNITGGEPFMRKDLFEIFEQLVDRRIHLSQIYTNGSMLTKKALDRLEALGQSPTFCISFDGSGTHDRMRGVTGSESTVIEAIRQIQEKGLRAIITTSIDPTGAGSLLETYELMRLLGVQTWKVSAPFRTGNWGRVTASFLGGGDSKEDLPHAEAEAAFEPVLRRWLDDGQPFHLKLGQHFDSRADAVGPEVEKPRPGFTAEDWDCTIVREMPYVQSNGVMQPCHAYTGTSVVEGMPNILEQGLPAIWTRSALREMVDTKKADVLQVEEECAVCEYFAECGSSCRAMATINTGQRLAKDPDRCALFKGGSRRRLFEAVGIPVHSCVVS